MSRGLLSALPLVSGSARLIGLRWALLVVCSLPAVATTASGLAETAGRRPYYTEVEGRLPVVHLARLMADLPGGFAGAAALGMVLAVILGALVTGGALSLLDPARRDRKTPKYLALHNQGHGQHRTQAGGQQGSVARVPSGGGAGERLRIPQTPAALMGTRCR